MFFRDVVGQHKVKQRLVRLVKENRVSHALLFLGDEGSGNLAMAVAFAQYLVCENPSEQDSCGVCPGCIKMQKLVHPDVTFSYPIASAEKQSKPRKSVDFIAEWRHLFLRNSYLNFNDWVSELEIENKQGIISVEESADILRRLSLTAVEAPCRIVIIWLAEKLHPAAANKLLKIIEEPPDQTYFFLVSENYEQIIPTILSRTQLIKLNPIADEDIADVLVSRHSVSKDAARKMAHRAGGNYREALSFLEHPQDEENLNARFLEWMRLCLQLTKAGKEAEGMKKLSSMLDELAPIGRESQKQFLQNGLHILRECLVINYADRSMVRFEGEELESFRKFAPFVNRNNAEQFVEEFNNASFHLERNAHFKILFTDLSFTANRLLQVK